MTDAIPHGGRLLAARGEHPCAPEPWLDLSTGINPQGWPGRRASRASLGRLPDPADLAALEATAARAFGTTPDRVVAIAGAEAALRLLPTLIAATRVAIAGPTYGSHADAWRQAGAEVFETGRDTLFDEAADVRIIVNPNNPDGATTAGTDLVARSTGRWLVIDESFIEVDPELSAAPLQATHTVVLRSFGKFYGLAGVRLGFVVAPPDMIQRFRGRIGDWAVGADAIAMGQAAYADPAWAHRTRRRLAADSSRLDAMLRRSGFQVLGGTSLFRLTRCEDAAGRAWRLGERGILVRTFDHDPGLIRFGLPNRPSWKRLQLALEQSQ